MKNIPSKDILSQPYVFFKRILHLMFQPIFLSLAVIGNVIIFIAAASFYFAESSVNPKIHSFLDVLWWSVATATTVGYGDVSPVTTTGKWIGIIMMLFGATLFCSFTALFATTLMSGQLNEVGKEVKNLKQELHEIEDEVHFDEKTLDTHLSQIELLLGQIKNFRNRKKS